MTIGRTITVTFTESELAELVAQLGEDANEMDDDGRVGAFDASPLGPIYRKLIRALSGAGEHYF